jgi:hypothetical protein
MAYKILTSVVSSNDLVRLILSFKECNAPDPLDPLRQDQLGAVHYYIVYIVPKARRKYLNWRQYLMYNPFVQSYLLSRRFYD